jgi:hypothetical protein
MMVFFGELGFRFPQYPFIGHSRGWASEDMDNNVNFVIESEALREEARGLAERSVAMSAAILKK